MPPDDSGESVSTSMRERLEMSNGSFLVRKKQTLAKFDRSTKGSIDEPIVELVGWFNQSDHFYTTSSCSGRLTVFAQHDAEREKSKGIDWQISSHEKIQDPDTFVARIEQERSKHPESTSITLKFEPFILHVCCESQQWARDLLHTAVACGYRNSGITLGNTGRVMVAIRCTLGLEVPLMFNGHWLVSSDYLRVLIEISNDKFEANQRMIEKFQSTLATDFSL